MKIISITLMPPIEENAAWWRIKHIAKLIEDEGYEVDVKHYVIKGSQSHKNIDKLNIPNGADLEIRGHISVMFSHALNMYRKRYDVCYANIYVSAAIGVFGKFLGKTLICDMHGISDELFLTRKTNIEVKFNQIMENIALRYSDKIICVSNRMIKYLNIEKNVPLTKLAYVTNGVDLNLFKTASTKEIEELKSELGIKDSFIFGYIGGFQAWQGVDKLIKAVRNFPDPGLTFLFVGDEKKSENGNIIFVPRAPTREVIKYYSICDVLILPRPKTIATEVAAPTKFAEYVAMGKPILTTDVGDASQLVKMYKNGLVVENNEETNLIDGINQFLSMKKQDLIQMGLRSRNLAEEEFDWLKISKDLISAINDSVLL